MLKEKPIIKSESALKAEEGKEGVSPESKEPGRFDHLKAGIAPIMAAVGQPEDFKEYPGPTSVFDNPEVAETFNVDYWASPIELERKGFLHGGWHSYVISTVDGQDKFSKEFQNCTGLVIAGQDKKTGENISFLSHENAIHFLSAGKYHNNYDKFATDLRQRLTEMKERCVEGTIDARIVGGNYVYDPPYNYKNSYLESIRLLSSEVSNILGFEPVVVMGPKTNNGKDDVYYDNTHRRLYIVRPVVGDATSESFVAKDLGTQQEKWSGIEKE